MTPPTAIRTYTYPVRETQVLLPCTVVIPTRRRCPEPQARLHYNPLSQCLDSLLGQHSKPQQVLIAAALARDYTAQALEYYQRAFAATGMELTVLWLPDQDGLGPFGKIAQALPAITHDFVHLVEDDVFLHPDAIGGSFQLMECLRRGHPQLALLNLPLYRRATRPTKFLPYREIGQLNTLRLTGCFESVFPRELLDDREAVGYPQENGLLAHPIDFFRGGNNLITRQALESLRGVRLGTPYGWEVSAGLHLTQQQWQLLSIPYMNLAGMHSFYGAHWGRKRLLGRDWTRDLPGYAGLSLPDIVRNAVDGQQHTGLGPLPLPIYYFRVATCYALILRHYAPTHFISWLRKLQAGFVDRVHSDITAGRQKVTDRVVRASIFLAALEAIVEDMPWLPADQVLRSVEVYLTLRDADRRAKIAEAMEQACATVAEDTVGFVSSRAGCANAPRPCSPGGEYD